MTQQPGGVSLNTLEVPSGSVIVTGQQPARPTGQIVIGGGGIAPQIIGGTTITESKPLFVPEDQELLVVTPKPQRPGKGKKGKGKGKGKKPRSSSKSSRSRSPGSITLTGRVPKPLRPMKGRKGKGKGKKSRSPSSDGRRPGGLITLTGQRPG